jgi:transcriptional regulator with XRE-family HTH domain
MWIYFGAMHAATVLRDARHANGLTQAALAALTGTSQATISAYESGRKVPTLSTFERLLAATGTRLAPDAARRRTWEPSHADHARAERVLRDVLTLAAALPTRHAATLAYPRLPEPRSR